ncbi:MAG: twin-arginine translocation signal domain-containing protein, partial [Candidatus Hydrogenedentes bacterium]|nr:twin-arginine translocation signal domain-containing protein [Candidatus Hydrogenedentota bacterium]
MSTPKRSGITRRSFMKDAAGVALVATAGNAAHGDSLTAPLAQTLLGAQDSPLEWKNWSGSVTCAPRAIERPTSEEEVVDIVRRANPGG